MTSGRRLAKDQNEKLEHWRDGGQGVGSGHTLLPWDLTPGGRDQEGRVGTRRWSKIMGMIKPQASSLTLTFKELVVLQLYSDESYFYVPGFHRYQTQRTKINLKEQRRLVERARCFPACQTVKATSVC